MTPEQRKKLKQVAQAMISRPDQWVAQDFHSLVDPATILSLIAQVEALTVPQGYRLVPIEPTEAMMDAMEACSDDWPRTTWKQAWTAALSNSPEIEVIAAPTIPAIPGTKEGA